MPAFLILLPLAGSPAERPFPTMQACERAAPAIAQRHGRGIVWVCATRAEGADGQTR